MEDAWSHSGGGVWALRFSRRLNDWEVFDVECFLLRLQGRRVCSDVEDQVVWTKAKDRRFSVKSLYKALEPKRLGDFPSRVIWNSLVPPRVSFFAWEAMWKKALTLDRIQRRGFSLASLWLIDVICACQRNSLLITSSCIVWARPFSVREALLGWLGPCVGKERKKVWFSARLRLF